MPELWQADGTGCKTIDLGKWVTGSYRIPTDEVPEEGDLEALLRDREDER